MMEETMPKLCVHPLTADRWADFEALFGSRGACGGCWCMTPRLPRAEYERNKGEGNRRAMKAAVGRGEIPGILGYLGDKAVAWCSLGPREHFSWLARSRIFQPVDDRPVWSIVCFFIDKEHRRQGLSVQMIEAACTFAAEQGAQCVEAYPVEPKKSPMPPVFAHTGLAAAFLPAGFREVARRSETRPIMRYDIRRRD
ncbi:MAG: GNAT family N-acetyltransferase [Xanthomonadales bacterium]|nr:GNAT family N-acetyltransferase [Xanthomonadales bacterium]